MKSLFFSRTIEIITGILLIIAIIWSFFPILLIVTSSFTSPDKLFSFPPTILSKPTLVNYSNLLIEWPKFFDSLINSVITTIGAVILTAVVCLPAAYSLSRYKNKFTYSCGMLGIIIRMFPPIIITIPLFPILQQTGLVDNSLVLIFLYTSFYLSLGQWVLKNFIDTIPIEFEEAAAIEGASNKWTFFKIIVPLSSSGVVSISILVAIFAWNEFMFAFLFTSYKAVTAPVVLNEMLGAMFGVSWGPLFAATTLQLVPILIFIWLVQKLLVSGMAHAVGK